MEIHGTFSSRLHAVLDARGTPKEGRQADLWRMVNVALAEKKLPKVTRGGVGKWLNGTGYPTMEKVIVLCQLLHVSVEWILTGRGPRDPDVRPQRQAGSFRDIRIATIISWVETIDQKPEQERTWFSVQFRKSFPEFLATTSDYYDSYQSFDSPPSFTVHEPSIPYKPD